MDRNYSDVVNRALELEGAQGQARMECQQRYDEATEALALTVVATSRKLSAANAAVNDEMDDIVRLSEPGLHPLLDKVRYDLLNRVQNELGPSREQMAMRTRLLGLGAVAAILLILAGAVALRQYNAIPITDPLESRAGIEQRAAALAKVIRYDDWNPDTQNLRGVPRRIALWPFEPTETEIRGARELAAAIAFSARELQAAGQVCKLPSLGGPVTEDQIGLLSRVVTRVRDKATVWRDPPAATVFDAIRASYPC